MLIGRKVRQLFKGQHDAVRVESEQAAELIVYVPGSRRRQEAKVLASRLRVSLSKDMVNRSPDREAAEAVL